LSYLYPILSSGVQVVERNIHEELVVYQSPLLRMKIWEIRNEHQLKKDTPAPIRRWHFHQEAEFVLLLEGEIKFYVDQSIVQLGPGDVLIVGPSQLHSGRGMVNGIIHQIVCQFDLKQYLDSFAAPYSLFFSDARTPLSRLNEAVHTNQKIKEQIAGALLNIYEESQSRKVGYELAVSMHMKHIMLMLLRHCGETLKTAESGALEALRPVLTYVDNHYMDKIDLRTASQMANMSYHYVSRLFSRTLGISFTEYMNRKRIQAAERLLVTNNMNVADVGAAVGISNTSHFFETFRKVNGCSPTEFRKRLQAKQESNF